MHTKIWAGSIALTAVLGLATVGARAWDETKYPDLGGQWKRPPGIGNQFDISKPTRLGQRVPLTPEYEAIYEAGLQDQNEGGQGNDPTYQCIPDGMPRVMNVIFPMEIVVTPKTTYILIEYLTQQRRIFTDGRKFPDDFPPSFQGYSVGNWIDENGDGKYRRPRSRDALSEKPAHVRPERRTHACGWQHARSRNASTSTRPIRTCCTTTSRRPTAR